MQHVLVNRDANSWSLGAAGEQSQAPPPARPDPAAKEYAFTLDPFQQTAINCLETGAKAMQTAGHLFAYAMAAMLEEQAQISGT